MLPKLRTSEEELDAKFYNLTQTSLLLGGIFLFLKTFSDIVPKGSRINAKGLYFLPGTIEESLYKLIWVGPALNGGRLAIYDSPLTLLTHYSDF